MDCRIIENNLDAVRALARSAWQAIEGADSTTCRARLQAMRDALDAIDYQLDTLNKYVPLGWDRVA